MWPDRDLNLWPMDYKSNAQPTALLSPSCLLSSPWSQLPVKLKVLAANLWHVYKLHLYQKHETLSSPITICVFLVVSGFLWYSICCTSILTLWDLNLRPWQAVLISFPYITMSSVMLGNIWPSSYNQYMSHVMRKPVYSICEQKCADQPMHPSSLISTFVVRCLDGIIPLLDISEISKP